MTEVVDLRDQLASVFQKSSPDLDHVEALKMVDGMLKLLAEEGYAVGVDPEGDIPLH